MENERSRILIIGVGDLQCSAQPGDVLATYALGTCVGISLWDASTQVGGILHFMLPHASLNQEKARVRPGTFCDTGLEKLLQDMEALGAKRRLLRVNLAGGISAQGRDFFDIGRRNLLAARRKLWELGLAVESEDVGGELSRTLKLYPDSGRVTVRDYLGERELALPSARRKPLWPTAS